MRHESIPLAAWQGDCLAHEKKQSPSTDRGKPQPKASTEEPVRTPFPIVAIGASAGGIEAIRKVLANLPATLGAGVVVIAHLDPNRPSHLREVLGQVSSLPVDEAVDGAAVELNHVYVIPPNKDLTFSCGMLQVSPRRDDRRLYDPIDCFFISLAREHGEHAIGVVLSGSGSDGAAGVREITARGGVTLVQEESTAGQPHMPRAAIATGAADYVLPPEDIARELAILARAMGEKSRADEAAFSKSEAKLRITLLSRLQERTKVDFENYKQSTIWRRVSRRMAIKRLETFRDYVDYCQIEPNELDALYKDILINVTSFFRDEEVFATLDDHVFPNLLANRSGDDPLRVWVPGCSTGEEAYSLAITALENLAKRSTNVPVQIFGTDVNEAVIERARTGVYTEKIADTVSPERLERFFVKNGRGYQVTKPVRDLCIFARQNVVADPPLSRMDLISCRNLLIYLGPTLQRKVIPRLHYALRPSGFLVLGKSELIDIFADLFSPVDKRTKLYIKKATVTPGLDLGGPLTSLGATRKAPTQAGVFVELETQREMDRLIATRYSPPAIAVNEALDILQVRGDIKPFLDVGSGLWSGNLARMVQHDFARKVQELVERAASGRGGSASVEGLRLRSNGSVREVNLKFIPLHSASERERRFLLILETPKKAVKPAAILQEPASPRLRDVLEEKARLEEELRLTREHLQATIDEREIRNEELQAANEEILSNNEELQTMNQELETSKEELESTNEELATLNEELQRHVEELRKSEERFRILVSSVKEYAIFMLDNNGIILSWNDGAERIKGYKASEVIGKHFSVFYPPEVSRTDKLKKELETAAREGVYTEEGIRMRKDGTRFWASVVLTALLDDKGHVYGFAKVTRDITEKKIAEEKLRLSEEKFRILVSGVKDYAIFMMDPTGHIVSWNEGAERINGYKPDEIMGKHFSTFYTEPDKLRRHPEHELDVARKVGKYEEEGVRVRKDGTTFIAHVLITALYDEKGELRGFGKVTRDVTERRRAEEALRRAHADLERRVEEATATVRQQEARLRLITNALPVLISYIQPDGRFSFTNDAYERWFGRPAEQFLGKTLAEAHGEKAFAAIRPHLERALSGESVSYEAFVEYESAPARYIKATYVPDFEKPGKVRGVIALIEDVSERKRNEEDLKRYSESLKQMNKELAASNAELSQFAHISSHDLKEPLRMVKVYTQLIDERYRDRLDEKGREFMSFIVEGATRMHDLINDLLAYSAVGRADAPLGQADLGRAVSIALSNLRESINEAKAEVLVEAELPTVRGNESQLAQVFQNLVGNGIKFRRGRPRVRIRAETRPDEWHVMVKDNGIGIEPQYLEKVFVIFQRLHTRMGYPGTGIGLAICKRIIERHGGRIWATSEVGKGSTFHFTLPKGKAG